MVQHSSIVWTMGLRQDTIDELKVFPSGPPTGMGRRRATAIPGQVRRWVSGSAKPLDLEWCDLPAGDW